MTKSIEIRTGRHCVFNIHVHLVFVTKYRKAVFQQCHYETMAEIFGKVCGDFEAKLVAIDGEGDHVHLLVNYPPKIAVASLVNSLKGVSSRLLKQKHPELAKVYWDGALWSPSYFAASCGGAPLEIIKEYIEEQRA